MKEKILMLIIGFLIGAIITAGCFLIFYKKGITSNFNGKSEFGDFRQGEMRDRHGDFEQKSKNSDTLGLPTEEMQESPDTLEIEENMMQNNRGNKRQINKDEKNGFSQELQNNATTNS